MALYDGLPLNTPTKIDAASVPGDFDTWATRTTNGGLVEQRPIAGGPTALAIQADTNGQTLRQKAQTALTANATFLGLASPTNAQVVAQVQALSKECNALIRLVIGQLDVTTGT